MRSCCDEYCSTHGCNQGRDCPVRVARIGRKDYDREALPPSVWRAQMRSLAKWLLILLALLFYMAVAVALVSCTQEQRTYDCSMASFHPDFPPQVREACRKRFTT